MSESRFLESVHCVPFSPREARLGLHGRLSFAWSDGTCIEDVILRTGFDGRTDLRFPTRRSGEPDVEEQILTVLEQASEGTR